MDSFWTGFAVGAVSGPLVAMGACELVVRMDGLRVHLACWRRGHDWRLVVELDGWRKDSCARCVAYRVVKRGLPVTAPASGPYMFGRPHAASQMAPITDARASSS